MNARIVLRVNAGVILAIGLAQVGATESFEVVNPFGRVVLTVCMLLGRLEIFTVLALLSPAFWRR
jgi:trk system potassium uptake protein TrkH